MDQLIYPDVLSTAPHPILQHPKYITIICSMVSTRICIRLRCTEIHLLPLCQTYPALIFKRSIYQNLGIKL